MQKHNRLLSFKGHVEHLVKSAVNTHKPSGSPNVFLFSAPRGGSTWLMELIWGQPGFKGIDEPLNLRKQQFSEHLGITEWEALYSRNATEKLQRYFEGFCDGTYHFAEQNPLRSQYYRYRTHRIVFKMLHGGENRINWFRDTFDGRIVLLLRHPIAVSLSREQYPRLEAFMASDYRRHFTDKQLAFAEKTLRSGSNLERGVLSWCFQTAVPLKQVGDDWVVASYEQLILEPTPVLNALANKLELPAPQRMNERLRVASNSTYKSDQKTRKMLSRSYERDYLIKKWQNKVTQEESQRAMEILNVFELDTYTAENALPHQKFWMR